VTVRTYPFSPPERLVLDGFFADLREREPVSRIKLPFGGTAWLVTRYEDARAVLSDARFGRAAATGPDVARMTPEPGGAASILFTDPPEHSRMRRLVSKWFTGREIERMRGYVATVADELLSTLEPPVDLVDAYAVPLPVRVICEMLGVPHEDRHRFRAWVEPVMSSTAHSAQEIRAALDEFADYLVDLVDERRTAPTTDLIGTLVSARDSDGALTEQELVTFVGVLLVAGQENTSNQIANFTYTLLSEPGLVTTLRERPEIVPQAVEELLRYLVIGTGVTFARIALTDVDVGGTTIPAGDAVMISLAAANRDPRVFADPEAIDLDRAPNPHLVFGPGTHHCLGASLARMELQEAIGALVRRFPTLRLAVDPQEVPWKSGLMVRGPVSLPVTW